MLPVATTQISTDYSLLSIYSFHLVNKFVCFSALLFFWQKPENEDTQRLIRLHAQRLLISHLYVNKHNIRLNITARILSCFCFILSSFRFNCIHTFSVFVSMVIVCFFKSFTYALCTIRAHITHVV